jgi:transcription initiation factor TFIIF subunit alpha
MKRKESESDSEDENKKEGEKDGKDKPGTSGVSSKGNNTPQGKKAAAEAAKKGKSLKRPGSPMVSDSSGNESTRKKKKKTGPSPSSIAGSRSSTPMPGGKPRTGAGVTSDGEATGGEMSDGVGGKRKKKDRMKVGTGTRARGTPTGSRAGSPAPATSGSVSPAKGGPSTPRSPSEPITAQEIVDLLPEPPDGIKAVAFMKLFGGRVGDGPGQMSQRDWLDLVKPNAHYDKKTHLLSKRKKT